MDANTMKKVLVAILTIAILMTSVAAFAAPGGKGGPQGGPQGGQMQQGGGQEGGKQNNQRQGYQGGQRQNGQQGGPQGGQAPTNGNQAPQMNNNRQMQTPPEKPDDDQKNGKAPADGQMTPPEKLADDQQNGQTPADGQMTPPEKPADNQQNGNAPSGGQTPADGQAAQGEGVSEVTPGENSSGDVSEPTETEPETAVQAQGEAETEAEQAEEMPEAEAISEAEEVSAEESALLAGEDGDGDKKDEKETETEKKVTPEGKATVTSIKEGNTETVDPEDPNSYKNDTIVNDAIEKAKNAIQKAIDAVIDALTSLTDSATIVVEDGEYEGDITIDKTATHLWETIKDTFVLNIVSSSATRDENGNLQADAGDGVKVKGNIFINGLNVLLGGMTLSGDKKISVEDAHLDVIGTSGGDNVNVELGKDAGTNTQIF